jgi:hypothetical protein
LRPAYLCRSLSFLFSLDSSDIGPFFLTTPCAVRFAYLCRSLSLFFSLDSSDGFVCKPCALRSACLCRSFSFLSSLNSSHPYCALRIAFLCRSFSFFSDLGCSISSFFFSLGYSDSSFLFSLDCSDPSICTPCAMRFAYLCRALSFFFSLDFFNGFRRGNCSLTFRFDLFAFSGRFSQLCASFLTHKPNSSFVRASCSSSWVRLKRCKCKGSATPRSEAVQS